MGEQRTKAMLAGGVALLVTGLVVLALFVIPAARHSQMAMAQDEAPPAADTAGLAPEDMGGAPGAPPGMGGAPGAPAPAAAAPTQVVEPLEPSRPNPFAPRTAGPLAVAQKAVASRATRYGPKWSDLPIGEHVGFIRPTIPEPPTPPAPVISAVEAAPIRITSILWDASGQAQAAYETEEGRSGVLKPGDRIQGNTVIEITRSGVTLRDERSGKTQTLELRARSQRPASSGPRGGRGGAGGAAGGGARPPAFPAAPPG